MSVKAYILLKVAAGREREVCKKIADFDQVLDSSIIYGEYEIVAKISADELSSLEPFITKKIRTISGVLLTDTMIVAREYKGKAKRNTLKIESL